MGPAFMRRTLNKRALYIFIARFRRPSSFHNGIRERGETEFCLSSGNFFRRDKSTVMRISIVMLNLLLFRTKFLGGQVSLRGRGANCFRRVPPPWKKARVLPLNWEPKTSQPHTNRAQLRVFF